MVMCSINFVIIRATRACIHANGSFSYQPATNFHGLDVHLQGKDGAATSGVATVTINDYTHQ